ncbi:MAG: hypothetical protein ABI895_26675 [Deltaproteobacteria bacterium]
MSPPGPPFATRTWLVAALLALGACGCAALFGMDDASCSDCVSTEQLPAKPAALDPAAGGASGAAPGAATGDAQNGAPATGPDPGTARGPVQADPPPPDAGPDSSQPEREPCTRYCDAISSTCLPGVGSVPDNRAYLDRDACLKLCPYFPRAVAGDPAGGNTLECRLALLDSAEAAEASAACQAAGRSGQVGANLVCGSSCAAYCSLMQQICPTEFSALAPSCESVCAGLDDELAFDVTGDERSGNTVQCRLWHLGLAATCDPTGVATCLPLHCGHSAGASPCNAP